MRYSQLIAAGIAIAISLPVIPQMATAYGGGRRGGGGGGGQNRQQPMYSHNRPPRALQIHPHQNREQFREGQGFRNQGKADDFGRMRGQFNMSKCAVQSTKHKKPNHP